MLCIIGSYSSCPWRYTNVYTPCASFLVGEVFIHMGQEKVNEALEKAAEKLEEETSSVKKDIEEIEKLLSDLKVQLYAKFGDNINLESDWVREVVVSVLILFTQCIANIQSELAEKCVQI